MKKDLVNIVLEFEISKGDDWVYCDFMFDGYYEYAPQTMTQPAEDDCVLLPASRSFYELKKLVNDGWVLSQHPEVTDFDKMLNILTEEAAEMVCSDPDSYILRWE